MQSLCAIEDLKEGCSLGFQLPTGPVFAVKKQGKIFVYRNTCPHQGVELEWLENQFLDKSGTLIQCSTHGAQFLVSTGKCVAGPCLGESLKPVHFDIINNEIIVYPETG
jgi:nitrite reductase/ring-hydroxylating ferredoxin subunit